MMSSTATRQHATWKRHLLILRKRIVWFLVAFLPVLTPPSTHSQEKQDAASSVCVSNLKKIHAAILAYCADHDGYFPPADKWVGLIAPYVDDLKIFTCPAAPPTPGLSWVKVGGVAYPGHYGINQLLHNQDAADKGWCPIPTLETIDRPEETPLVIEVKAHFLFAPHTVYDDDGERDTSFAPRHEGIGHVLWLDGRVTELTWERYVELSRPGKGWQWLCTWRNKVAADEKSASSRSGRSRDNVSSSQTNATGGANQSVVANPPRAIPSHRSDAAGVGFQTSSGSPHFSYTIAGSAERILKGRPRPAKIASTTTLSMCAGERKSFQIAIVPGQDIDVLPVSVNSEAMKGLIELGQVEYVDISSYRFSKSLRTDWLPDPIVGITTSGALKLARLSENETVLVWVTIDLPEDFKAGSYTIKISIGDAKHGSYEVPIAVNVWDFSISKTPDVVVPFSDTATALGAYTGYLRESTKGNRRKYSISDREKYLASVEALSKDLVKHRITTGQVAAFGMEPWFQLSEVDGRWSCDASFFVETVKRMVAAGTRCIILAEGQEQGENTSKYIAVLAALEEATKANGWAGMLWLKIHDEPDNPVYAGRGHLEHYITLAKLAREFAPSVLVTTTAPTAELLPWVDSYWPSGAPKLETSKPMWIYYNHMTYESPLHGSRKAFWDLWHVKGQKYSYYAHNLWVYWNAGHPWRNAKSYEGLGECFMVYPPKDFPNIYDDFKGDQDLAFSVVPSIRYEGIVDGITDFLYLQKIANTIAALKKQGAGEEAAKGEAIVAKWEDYFSRRRELFVESKEFDQARWEMGDFISKNARFAK